MYRLVLLLLVLITASTPTLAKDVDQGVGQIPEINRVVCDFTSKPPGTIEWE